MKGTTPSISNKIIINPFGHFSVRVVAPFPDVPRGQVPPIYAGSESSEPPSSEIVFGGESFRFPITTDGAY